MSVTFDDEYAGQGGTYILDPKTGKRTLLGRTQDPAFPQLLDPKKPERQVKSEESTPEKG